MSKNDINNDENKKGGIRKEKKSLKFQLPEVVTSEESFTSALSLNVVGNETEGLRKGVTTPVLKKFITSPIRHACPRVATAKPCFKELNVYEDVANRSFINLVSSSKQLVEVSRNSPTHSEANFNLINSSYLRKLEGVKEAIRNGANVNTFRDSESPLVIAAELGDDRLTAYLLTVPEIDINFRNIFGETPLLIAVRNTFNKIVKLLLSYNADVNVTNNMGKSPLHVALFQQRPQMARLLLAHGADVRHKSFESKAYDQWDAFGERAIYTSVVKKPNVECLTLLLKVGASPEYRGFSGTPLISRAIMNWTNFKVIETLVRYGASVNTRDFISGKTPLHFAAIINDVRVTEFLVNKGADVNLKTVYNVTPYDEAISHKSIDVAQFLVNITASANTRQLSLLVRNESKTTQGPSVSRTFPIPPQPSHKTKEKKKRGSKANET